MIKFLSRFSKKSSAAGLADPKNVRHAVDLDRFDWTRRRSKLSPQEQRLAPHVAKWWHALPEDRRPIRLAQRFPRIVNIFSLCWNDPRLTHETFESLLNDRRGGRQGFPAVIAAEIQNLREHYLGHRESLDLERQQCHLWDTGRTAAPSLADIQLGESWDVDPK